MQYYIVSTGGYTYSNHTPQMRNSGDATHAYLGCLPAAGVLTTLTANPRARYRAEKTYTPNPTAHLNANF